MRLRTRLVFAVFARLTSTAQFCSDSDVIALDCRGPLKRATDYPSHAYFLKFQEALNLGSSL